MTIGALVRYTAAAIIVAVAFALGVAVARHIAAEAVAQAGGASAAGPGTGAAQAPSGPETLQAMRPLIRHTRGGKLAWQAKLGSLKLSAGAKLITAGPLDEALIFSRDGRPVVRVTAKAIRGYADRRDFKVIGPVRAVSERGAIIEAAEMQWFDKDARLHCVGPVTARFRNAMATAPEADLYVEKDLVVVPGEVRLYVGDNLVVGRKLTYNINTDSFELQQVRAILHARKAKEEIEKLRR